MKDDYFASIEDEEGMLVLTPLKDGHVVVEVQEWHQGEPAEASSVEEARYVLSRREFLRLMDWGKKRM